MRLLLFSDLHLDTPFRWAGPVLARARRQAQREALRRICALARAERVDALLCAGDLYEHERFTPDTAALLRESFAEVEVPVLLAPGNHDWYGPASLYRQVAWSDNVHVFRDDRLTPVVLADGLTVWGAAHRAPANTDGFLDGFEVDRDGVNLALFHGSERSGLAGEEAGKAPHAPFVAAQIGAAGLAHAFLGHYHSPKDAEHHTYPGNPEPLAFGETGERGAVVATVAADGSVSRVRQRVAVSEVSDVEVDLSGAAHAGQVRDRVAAALAPCRGVVRVLLSGEIGPDVDVRAADLAGVAPHLEGLVPRLGRLTVGYDMAALALQSTVRGQFVRDVQAAGLDDDVCRRVLVTGLRALDGHTDGLEVP